MFTKLWTINVIDDNEAVRASTQALLQSFGYSVACFASAEEYLACLDEGAPGCAIVDVHMPGVDGLQLVQRLRHQVPHLAIVLMSGNMSAAAEKSAADTGATVLRKPIKEETLRDAILGSIKACMERIRIVKKAV